MRTNMPSSPKVMLVTGATNGIGRATAELLARSGATVVLVGRDPARADRAVQEIQQSTGNKNVSALLGDLALQRDVRRVAQEFKSQFDRLDVLVNNAGAMFSSREETAEGIEKALAVNYLSQFLLTRELLPLIEKNDQTRIVNLTSDAHLQGKVNFDDLQFRGLYWTGWVYGAVKRMIVMYTRELARILRQKGSGATVNCLHPGLIKTGIGQDSGKAMAFIMGLLMKYAAAPVSEGAENVVWLATSREVDGVSGMYFEKRKRSRPAKQALDDGACSRLWVESEKLVAASARSAVLGRSTPGHP